MNDTESQLKHLPRFQADELFKDKLKLRILREQGTQRSRVLIFLPRTVLITLLLILVIGGLSNMQRERIGTSPTSLDRAREGLKLFQAAPVSAAEIISENIQRFMSGPVIYHQKTRYFLYDTATATVSATIVYDHWNDLESMRFRAFITYPERIEDQGFNTDFRWEIRHDEKKIYKDLYIYQPGEDKEKGSSATIVDLTQKFDRLLKEGVLTSEEEEYEGKPAYIVKDTRIDPDKFWDVLFFDKESFRLLETQKFDVSGKLSSRLVYEIQESLPRTAENLADLFTFQLPAADYQVFERHFDTNRGYLEIDYYPVEQSPSATPTPSITPSFEPSPYATPSSEPQL